MLQVQTILFALVKILIIVGFLFNVGALLTWLDRRQSAMIQDRVGPNRALLKIGKLELRVLGLLHTAADGLKFFFKEDFVPKRADKLLFAIAPILTMVPVLALVAVIPFGDTLCLHSIRQVADGATWWPTVPRHGVCADFGVPLQVANLDVGLLFIFAISGQGIVAAAMAGWASDNKFSLMGALRAASQMVSYEVTLGMSLIGAMMIYGTVRLEQMAVWQGDHTWGIFVQPLAFFLFFAAAVAESKRIPFDLPEAESELVSGYFTEYSGMKFGMFYFAEYMEVATSSMLLVAIFLGGWQLPFLHRDGLTIEVGTFVFHQAIPHIWVILIGFLTFFGKTLALCFLQCFVRWSLPRFRYDQLMRLCWKFLLPLSLANIFVTGVVYLGLDAAGPALWNGLKMAEQLSQAAIVVVINLLLLWLVVSFFKPRRGTKEIVGSAASRAEALGGTPESPMQA
ncbi:MAG: NADH-quinone oxidoreductase subunit NuoH [Polyangiaceae bacterium]